MEHFELLIIPEPLGGCLEAFLTTNCSISGESLSQDYL